MVGFDVTPTTASSLIIRSSSPVSSSSRDSVSNQTLTPCCESSCSRDWPMPILLLHRVHLLQPLEIAARIQERCTQEPLHQLTRQRLADDFGAEAEHIHVVVLDALMRGVGVVADRRADAVDLARG